MGFIGVAIASLMMIVRVHAIYAGNRYVLVVLGTLFAVFVGLHSWLFTTTGPVIHPALSGCSLLFGEKKHIGNWTSSTAWSPLLLDTAVIVFVVWRTHNILKTKLNRQSTSNIVNVLIRDGIMYYTVIFAVNLILAIMIVSSPNGIKNLCAQLQLLLTVTMMSRITLNLRKNLHKDNQPELPVRNVNIDLSEHSRVHLHLTGLDAPPKALRKFGLHIVS
ncbi:hypothetical protein M422DRAFT_262901 [Sphaerobolus stellatus SS14]|uniref:Uncharacterized protein n=1 Tax=Sphaerobolus stellatus (strain SS14) TaxID=990650 RepID=A0A0C9VCB8_SPHS4|nr:hypothetical protein M422DRAFT_262901 [Sphaerobolus stellatus SS14]